ncbi:MAG: short chain dehydrogenase [Kribbellaceae bacterium]|nr:short chain dehydrogenase [Kribbellaceae bacterium]
MKILLVGASGTIGRAVRSTLIERKHDVVSAGRHSGDHHFDMTDPEQIRDLYERLTGIDAVAVAAGGSVFQPLDHLTVDDLDFTYRSKARGQMELVRQGLRHLPATGSFTLVTGLLSREPVPGSAAVAFANGAVEAFARAAAIEIAPRRVNVVSPGVVAESDDDYDRDFPGITPVPAAQVAAAYVRAIEGRDTGRVYPVGH